jgi:uncharacterized repeat protein (TIGR01451 family)
MGAEIIDSEIKIKLMQKFIQTILLLTSLTIAMHTQAQIINISDANFKGKLTNIFLSFAKDSLGNSIDVDLNNDFQIDQSEALRVYNLDIKNSNIQSLQGIEYFKNLFRLDCSKNSITNLSLSNNKRLQSLNCSKNQIINFNTTINSISPTITELICDSIGISNLILNTNNFVNLLTLSISKNKLTQFDSKITSCSKLTKLYCENNNLTFLDVSKFKDLTVLYCENNFLYNLDVSGLKKLTQLDCSYNNLATLFLKNDTINNEYEFNSCIRLFGLPCLDFSNNAELKYICTDKSDTSKIKRACANFDLTTTIVNTNCNADANGSTYSLHGDIKYDNSINGCQSNNVIFKNVKISINNSSDFVITDINNNFNLNLYRGSYQLTPIILNNYFICQPASVTVTLPEDTIPQQFCITPNGIHHDVSVTIIPLRDARPGFSDATYKIVIKNKGNQIENGTVLFNYDESRQDYISSTSTPLSLSSGELIFSFSNLQLFATYEIIVTMRTNAPTDNPAVNVGDVIQLSVTANLDNGTRDEFFKDNFQNIRQTVVGSFDPNDKTCLEGDIITPTLVGDFVHYLIRFENTGTANAENIVVTDFIDLNTFDISTLEITSTSHNCKTLISNGNKVQFVFDNINLPFTEPLKHGYVAFKLKLKNNLGIGDSLKNKADIYFDYNLPITTNIAASRIDNVTAIKTNANKDGSLSVYPNPGNGNFTVNFESPVRQTIIVKIVAINGNVVYEQNLYHNYQSQLQLNQNLPAGVYLITVNSEKEQYTQKLIITK